MSAGEDFEDIAAPWHFGAQAGVATTSHKGQVVTFIQESITPDVIPPQI